MILKKKTCIFCKKKRRSEPDGASVADMLVAIWKRLAFAVVTKPYGGLGILF